MSIGDYRIAFSGFFDMETVPNDVVWSQNTTTKEQLHDGLCAWLEYSFGVVVPTDTLFFLNEHQRMITIHLHELDDEPLRLKS